MADEETEDFRPELAMIVVYALAKAVVRNDPATRQAFVTELSAAAAVQTLKGMNGRAAVIEQYAQRFWEDEEADRTGGRNRPN